MRFYVKLFLLLAAFAALASPAGRRGAAELAYQARVQAVLKFGTQADYEALVDDTQRSLAAQCGRLDTYQAGKRYQALLAEALAEAAQRNAVLSDADLVDLRARCAREAFGPVLRRNARLVLEGRQSDGEALGREQRDGRDKPAAESFPAHDDSATCHPAGAVGFRQGDLEPSRRSAWRDHS